jgi:inositol-pentakisphosphate 2-kinase
MSHERFCKSTSDIPDPAEDSDISMSSYDVPDSDEFTEANHAFVRFEYLNQGGANVIFKIEIAERSGGNPWFYFFDLEGDGQENIIQHVNILNKVLRVNKGLDKTLRCDEVVAGFNNDVRPLFLPKPIKIITRSMTSGELVEDSVELSELDLTKFLMDHEGVMLYNTVVANLKSKCGTIGDEKNADGTTSHAMRWGILLPDMSATAGESVTIELKPKWLVQSPNAPPNAVHCRTCAMQVAKPKDITKHLCPIRLISDGRPKLLQSWILARVTEQLVAHSAPTTDQQRQELERNGECIAANIVHYLTRGEGRALLRHLQRLQGQLDRQGVCTRDTTPFKDTFDRNLRLAMTLRDCSMYITARYVSATKDRYGNCPVVFDVDSKLGDLDFKSADKISDWLAKEKELLDCEAYTKDVREDLGCVFSEKKAK